jgi:hypothetical protein
VLHVLNGTCRSLVERTFFYSLVYMPFSRLGCFGVVFLDVECIKHRPTHVVARLYGLEPRQFDRVSTHGVHPFDGLFG